MTSSIFNDLLYHPFYTTAFVVLKIYHIIHYLIYNISYSEPRQLNKPLFNNLLHTLMQEPPVASVISWDCT